MKELIEFSANGAEGEQSIFILRRQITAFRLWKGKVTIWAGAGYDNTFEINDTLDEVHAKICSK